MAGAHGVDVVALHQAQVLCRLLPADGVAGDRVAVVAVHASELDGHAVEEDHPVPHLDLSQAHLLGDDLVFRGEGQGVLGRVLRVPQYGIVQFKDQGLPCGGGGAHRVPIGGLQQGADGALPGELQFHGDGSVGEVLREILFHEEIPHMVFGPGQQVHVPEDAAHAQLVLVLQIGAVTPLEHQHGQGVVPGGEQGGDVELRGGVGHLAVPGKLPVDPQVEAGVHPFKVQIPAEGGGVGHVDVAHIQAAGVLLWHEGRVAGDGVADVGVLVTPVTLVLPAGGHGDLAHLLLVKGQAVLQVQNVLAGGEVLERPGAV